MHLYRCLIAGLLIVCMTACTTLSVIAQSPASLQQNIRAGLLLKTGDRVVITTSDASTHALVITRIGPDDIEAKNEKVAIDTVIAVKRREYSGPRTLTLILGIAAAVGLAILINSAAHSPTNLYQM